MTHIYMHMYVCIYEETITARRNGTGLFKYAGKHVLCDATVACFHLRPFSEKHIIAYV